MEDIEDFTYKVTAPQCPTIHFRELRPKDFYFAQVLRQSDRSQIELIERIILNPEVLEEISAKNSKLIFKWAVENLLEGVILTVENWLEVAFHLCKQRWNDSVDWLELQPMSKVNAMIQVVKNFADEQEQQAKKAARKKR